MQHISEWRECFCLFPRKLVSGEWRNGLLMRSRLPDGTAIYRLTSANEKDRNDADNAW